jgi:hypothetical protein
MGEIVTAMFAMFKEPTWMAAFAVLIVSGLWLWGDKIKAFLNRPDIKEPMKMVFWAAFWFVLCGFLSSAFWEGQRVSKELETLRAAQAATGK